MIKAVKSWCHRRSELDSSFTRCQQVPSAAVSLKTLPPEWTINYLSHVVCLAVTVVRTGGNDSMWSRVQSSVLTGPQRSGEIQLQNSVGNGPESHRAYIIIQNNKITPHRSCLYRTQTHPEVLFPLCFNLPLFGRICCLISVLTSRTPDIRRAVATVCKLGEKCSVFQEGPVHTHSYICWTSVCLIF